MVVKNKFTQKNKVLQKAKKKQETKSASKTKSVQEPKEEQDLEKTWQKHIKDISVKNPHDKFVRHLLSLGHNFRLFLEKI